MKKTDSTSGDNAYLNKMTINDGKYWKCHEAIKVPFTDRVGRISHV